MGTFIQIVLLLGFCSMVRSHDNKYLCLREVHSPQGFYYFDNGQKFWLFESSFAYEIQADILKNGKNRLAMYVDEQGTRLFRDKFKNKFNLTSAYPNSFDQLSIEYIEGTVHCMEQCVHVRAASKDYFVGASNMDRSLQNMSSTFESLLLSGKANYHTMLDETYNGYYAYYNETTKRVHFQDYRYTMLYAEQGDRQYSRPIEMVITRKDNDELHALPWDQGEGGSIFGENKEVPYGILIDQHLYLFTSKKAFVLPKFDIDLQDHALGEITNVRQNYSNFFECNSLDKKNSQGLAFSTRLILYLSLSIMVAIITGLIVVHFGWCGSRADNDSEDRIGHAHGGHVLHYKFKPMVVERAQERLNRFQQQEADTDQYTARRQLPSTIGNSEY